MKIRQIVKDRLDEVFGKNNYYLICVAITGSHAYGMQTSESDYDIMGLYLPPEDYILGMLKNEQIEIKEKADNVEGMLFSFQKWYHLMVQQNPNVIELLWHHPSMYVYKDSVVWPKLIAVRNQLLSKKLKHSFGGYAFAQLNRLNKLNEKINQNKKRLEEFKKYGYSVKNASHMMRLLNMCFDALVEKEVQVMRPERQLLISIREGTFTYKEIVKMANDKFALIEQAYMMSELRNNIDPDFANELHKEILRTYLMKLASEEY